MAITYTVTQNRGRGIDVTGSSEGFRWSAESNYTVQVSDPADSGFVPTDVDEIDLIFNAAIPRVNASPYTTTTGKQAPFMLCRSRRIERDKKNSGVFHVNARFEYSSRGSSEGSLAGEVEDPPVNLTDISPIVEVTLEEGERVLYEDKQSTPEAILTPTGNYFAEPTMERFAILKLTIKQYESSLSYEDFIGRKFKVNDATYRSTPAGTWLINDVRANEVDVQLSGGSTTAALVEYDLLYTDRDNGWDETKVLVDTHYLDSGKKKRFVDDDINSFSYGLLNLDGTKRTLASGPLTDSFKVYGDIDFSGFLQV